MNKNNFFFHILRNRKEETGTRHTDQCEINFNEHTNTDEFEMIINHLDLYQQTEIDKLIEKYKQVFAKDKYEVGTVKHHEAHIDLMVDK